MNVEPTFPTLEARLAHVSPHARRTYANPAWLTKWRGREETVRQIARRGSCQYSTVAHWLAQWNLTEKRVSHHDLTSHARKTYANPMWHKAHATLTSKELAVEAGCCERTLYNWRTRLFGLQPDVRLSHGAQKTYANRDWLVRHLAQSTTAEDLVRVAASAHVCCSTTTIHKWMRSFKLKASRPPLLPHAADRLGFGRHLLWLRFRRRFHLNRRQDDILTRFFGIDCPLETCKRLGERWQLSRERILQIIRSTLGSILLRIGASSFRSFPYVFMLAKKGLPTIPNYVRKEIEGS